jgi:DNA-binding beta-propeller fold protein YncE
MSDHRMIHDQKPEVRLSFATRFSAAISALLATLSVGLLLPTASFARSALPVMYVSDSRTNAINVFRLDDGRQIGSIAYPMSPGGKRYAAGAGVATDAQNNLWASFTFDDGRNFPGKVVIYGYAPGQIQWFTAIAGGCCGSPNLAVSNLGEIAEGLGFFPPDYAGGVGFVEPGKKYIGRYNLTLPGIVYEAYDPLGTLWIAGVDAGFRPHFGFIRRGSRTFEEVHCKVQTYLGPVAVDAAGYMLVNNDQTVYAYDNRGRLIYRVALTGAVGVANIALSHDGKTLYVAKTNGTILVYGFPAGGKPIAEYDVGGSPHAVALGLISV